MKSLLVFLIVLALTIGTVVTVFAEGPVQVPFEGEQTWPVAYCGDFGGGDFWIMDHEVWSGTDKLWFDEYDRLTRIKWRVGGTDNLFRVDDPDNVLSGNYGLSVDISIDPETDLPTKEHYAGIPWNIQIPGQGIILHGAGSAYWEDGELVREAGLRVFDLEALCQYFGP
jgi:hypothetical protein